MKHSLLVSIISTLAFSSGLVGAGPTLSTRIGQGHQAPIIDAMGIASNQIVCQKRAIKGSVTAYNKREAYAAVAQAMMYLKEVNHAVVGCESAKVCSKYPKKFNDNTIKFKLNGPYNAFPILPSGQIFKGRLLPVSDLVIFRDDGEVAGIVYAGMNRYHKCLLDENYVQRPKGIINRLDYMYQYHTGKLTRAPN